ncbi:MAG: PAS domain S-box protein, partial [bacterium]|nr:PAS domain S-box protein [bacterium]
MIKSPQHALLQVLVLESAPPFATTVGECVSTVFPDSRVDRAGDPESFSRGLAAGEYDLFVLSLAPLAAAHGALLHEIRQRAPASPALLLVRPADEESLIEMIDAAAAEEEIPDGWEVAACEQPSPRIIGHHLHRAVSRHRYAWEAAHLTRAFQSSLARYRHLFDESADLLYICDRKGCLTEVNARVLKVLGRPKVELLMKPVWEVFGFGQDVFEQLVAGAAAGDEAAAGEAASGDDDDANGTAAVAQEVEIECHPPDGPTIYGMTQLKRWQDDSRRVHFQGIIRDVSPHRQLERQLRHSEEKYKTLYSLARISSSSLRLGEVTRQSLRLMHRCCQSRGTLLLLNRHYEELNLQEAVDLPDDLMQEFERAGPPHIGRDLLGRWAITPGVHSLLPDQAGELHPVVGHWLARHPDCVLVGSTLGRGNPILPAGLLLMLIPRGAEQSIQEDLEDESGEGTEGDMLTGLSKTLEMGITNCFYYAHSQETELRYRELWENAPALFISVLKRGIIYEINQTAVQALGYSLQELIGQSFHRIVHPDDAGLFDRHHQALMQTGVAQGYELRLIKRNGDQMVVRLKSEPVRNRDGDIIGEKSVLHDITHDKEMEAQLRDYAENLEKKVEERTTELTETMNFLHGILEGSTEYAIAGLDEKGRFLHFNQGAQLLFGQPAEEVVNREGLERFIDFGHAPWSDLAGLLRAVDDKGVLTEELSMLRTEGRSMIALLTINRLKSPAANRLTYVAIVRDITEQKELEDLLKLYTENLQQVIDQKSRELDRQHIQLIQSSKLATLGEMATGIAHELNQPLSGIRTRAQLILKALERNMLNPERIDQGQNEIIQLVDRITRIIHHMRIFARQDQQQFAPFKLTQSIEGALSLLGEQLRIHGVEVETEIPGQVPLVLGEPLQIEQVILNLMGNARDSLDERAEMERAGGARAEYAKVIRLRIGQETPHEVCLWVIDNGTGMTDEVKQKIFEPFYTTKPVGARAWAC